jgi:threonine/homoserine/homoserine lactone efflux protein
MLTFAAAVFLLIITPGPGVLSTAGVGAAYGFRAGLRYVLGLFIGTNLVALAVVTGLAALILANPVIRTALFAASTCYLLYLAARIAFAGSKVAFIEARKQPGTLAGILLQTINPKAYAVNTTLFSGFVIFADAYWTEVIVKFLIVNAIWIPIHLVWLYAGSILERLDLPQRTHRIINVAMATAMLGVVALAAWSSL